MPDPDRFTLDDLVHATVDRRRRRHAVPELRDWHEARHEALLAALTAHAVAPEEAAPAWLDRAQLGPFAADDAEILVDAVLDALDAVRSPFAGFLEAPPLVGAFYARYAAPIDRRVSDLSRELHGLLGELLAIRHGIPASASVGADDLRKHGFDPDAPAPDPYDFD